MRENIISQFEEQLANYKSLEPIKKPLMDKVTLKTALAFDKFDQLTDIICDPLQFILDKLAPLLAQLAPLFDFINKLLTMLHCIQDATNSPSIIPVTDFGINPSLSSVFNPSKFSLNYTTDENYPNSYGSCDRNLNFEKTNLEKRTTERHCQSGNFEKIDKEGNTMQYKKGHCHSTIGGSQNTCVGKDSTTMVEGKNESHSKKEAKISSDEKVKLESGGCSVTVENGVAVISGDLRVTGSITDSRGNLTNFKTTDGSSRA